MIIRVSDNSYPNSQVWRAVDLEYTTSSSVPTAQMSASRFFKSSLSSSYKKINFHLARKIRENTKFYNSLALNNLDFTTLRLQKIKTNKNRENTTVVPVVHFLAVDNFDFTRKINFRLMHRGVQPFDVAMLIHLPSIVNSFYSTIKSLLVNFDTHSGANEPTTLVQS